MNIIGFSIKKLSAEKKVSLKPGFVINTNIDFIDILEEKIPTVKDLKALKVTFSFEVVYGESEKKKDTELGKITMEGMLIASVSEEEQEEVLKSWRKKTLSNEFKLPLFNFILKRCALKALQLEDEVGLPPHVLLPQVKEEDYPSKEDNKK